MPQHDTPLLFKRPNGLPLLVKAVLSMVHWFLLSLIPVPPSEAQTALEELMIDFKIESVSVSEVDPATGELISAKSTEAEFSFSGIREEYIYILEGSADLKIWKEIDRFNGLTNESTAAISIAPFEDGFARLKLVEKPAIPPNFVTIPAGTFTMGSPIGELGRDDDETAREVTLTSGFHASKTETTWAEWVEVRDWARENGYTDLADGQNGRDGDESGMHPVTGVSWFSAIKWCNARSEREGRQPVYYTSEGFEIENIMRVGVDAPFANWSADGYRLPTEAEWEYACRAESNTAFHNGDITQVDATPVDPNLDSAGWYAGNSENATHPVGSKQANFWGLFDTHGNVREWCWD